MTRSHFDFFILLFSVKVNFEKLRNSREKKKKKKRKQETITTKD